MRKLSMFLVALMLVVGFAGPAAASYSEGSLIRVVYDKNVASIEIGTDLLDISSWTSAASTPDNQIVGGGSAAWDLDMFDGKTYADLKVLYFASAYVTDGKKDAWTSGPETGQTIGGSKGGSFSSLATSFFAGYNAQNPVPGNSTEMLQSNVQSGSYLFLNNSNVAWFGGFLNNTDAGVSLADLASVGYVDQTLYFYDDANPRNGATGTGIATLRTLADGSTIINPSAVPIPGALVLLGSGLMGLVAVRRRSVH